MNDIPPSHILCEKGGCILYEFTLQYNHENIGNVIVERIGLYYRISCRAHLKQHERVYLSVHTDAGWVNLGLCVPQGTDMVLHKMISVKDLPGTDFLFRLSNKSNIRKILIAEDRPFEEIENLPSSQLEITDVGHFAIMKD